MIAYIHRDSKKNKKLTKKSTYNYQIPEEFSLKEHIRVMNNFEFLRNET